MFYIVKIGDHKSCGVFRTREKAEAALEARSYWFVGEEVITEKVYGSRLRKALLDIEYSFWQGTAGHRV